MKVYDTFMYNGEADVLECRLTELCDYVDKFVIVEASRTHGGNRPKPFHYLDFQNRFAHWRPQIRYIMISKLPEDENPWTRENAQRNHILDGLHDAAPDDIIMISDVDEIPKGKSIAEVSASGTTVFLQRLYCMNLNWYDPTPWFGTIAMPFCELVTPQQSRDDRRGADVKLHDAGWHISWLGSDSVRHAKFHNGCHYDDYKPEWNVETGMFLGTQLLPVSYNNTYPLWINEGHAPARWFE